MFKNSSNLIGAVLRSDTHQVRQLLAAGAEPRSRDARAWTALHLAAGAGACEIVAALLDAGADVDAVAPTTEVIDRDSHEGSATPLMVAVQACHAEAALLLLERGAGLRHRDAFSGEDALFQAAERGLHAVVARMLKGEERPVGRSAYRDEEALEVALVRGHLAVAELLSSNGYVPTAKAVCLACRRGYATILPTLVAAGASLEQTDGRETPLCAAASGGVSAGHLAAVRWLVEHGASVDATHARGKTPLGAAASHGHVDNVRLLLELGANPTLRDGEGKTALDWAHEAERRDVVRLLGQRGLR